MTRPVAVGQRLLSVAVLLVAIGLIVAWLTREGPVTPAAVNVSRDTAGDTASFVGAANRSSHSQPPVDEVKEAQPIPVELTVRVRSGLDGQPLAGAAVHLRASGTWRLAGLTDSSGLCILDVLDARPDRVGASAKGFRSDEVVCDSDPGEVVELTLHAGEVLAGRAVWVKGARVKPHEVQEIVAIPSWAMLPEPMSLEDGGFPPGTLRAPIEADGSFRFHEADPETTYRMFPSAPGVVTVPYPPTPLVSSETPIVHVGRLFAAMVELEDSAGGPLRTHPEAYTPRGFLNSWDVSFRPHSVVIYPVEMSALEWFLAGVDPAIVGRPTRDRHLFAYVSTRDAFALGPLVLDAQVPGYERSLCPLELPWVAGGFGRARCALRATTPGWGSAMVVLDGLPPGPDGTHLPFAVFRLHSRGPGTSRSFETRLAGCPWDLKGRVRIDGVPEGEYLASLHLPIMLADLPGPERVRIETGQATQVNFDLSGLGTVEVRATDRRGLPMEGRFSVELKQLSSDSGGRLLERTVALQNPPARIAGLAPGTWSLKWTGQLLNRGAWEATEEVAVKSGEVAIATLDARHDSR